MKTGWPFDSDYGLAKEWLLAAIQQDPANLHILHQALSIGLYKEVARMLETLPINDDAKTTLLYRIYLQKEMHFNLIAQSINYIIQHGQDAIERAQKENMPLDVVLIGGIGDHLETISHITAWQEQTPIKLNLKLSKQRKRQLATIIESLPLISLNPTKEIPLDFRTLRQRILVDQTRVLTKAIYQPATCNSKKQILCCWRAQAGLGEHFSVHVIGAQPSCMEILPNFIPKISRSHNYRYQPVEAMGAKIIFRHGHQTRSERRRRSKACALVCFTISDHQC